MLTGILLTVVLMTIILFIVKAAFSALNFHLPEQLVTDSNYFMQNPVNYDPKMSEPHL
jgi:hypothetical protein